MKTLRAIIFDFDGVIADTEPIHCASFQAVLGEINISLAEADYYDNYLGYDDKGCFAAILAAHGHPAPAGMVAELVVRKAETYLRDVRQHLTIFPGVQELVCEAAQGYPLAIASGALRHEIEFILKHAGIRDAFEHIISSEDVAEGKPSPQSFLYALAALNRWRTTQPLTAQECLVIEDSLPGIRGAHAAGMKVLAVANTHTIQDLHEADVITHSLEQVDLQRLCEQLWQHDCQ
ncbi:MAG: HAD family hydrolase [Nitrospiraceae bacterium]